MASRAQRPGQQRLICWQMLCLLAMALMALLAIEHLGKAGGLVSTLCRFQAGLSCAEAMGHPAANVLSLPVPYWAIAYYTILLYNGPQCWQDRLRYWLSGLMVGGLILSTLIFLLIMERDLAKPCPLCLATHLCHLLLLLTLVTAGRAPCRTLPLGASEPRPLPLALPLLILLLSALLTLRQQGVEQTSARERSLMAPELLSSLVADEYDRFFPARPEHRIGGAAQAPHELVIIGSLSCGHCRNLIRTIPALMAGTIASRLAISFISYPLASGCNPLLKTEQGLGADGAAECRLAVKTLLAQQQGNFWSWFKEVDQAPGRSLRQLRQQAVPEAERAQWGVSLGPQLDPVAAIPIQALPTLLWQGRKLPASFGGLPLPQLIQGLMEVERRGAQPTEESDCGC